MGARGGEQHRKAGDRLPLGMDRAEQRPGVAAGPLQACGGCGRERRRRCSVHLLSTVPALGSTGKQSCLPPALVLMSDCAEQTSNTQQDVSAHCGARRRRPLEAGQLGRHGAPVQAKQHPSLAHRTRAVVPGVLGVGLRGGCLSPRAEPPLRHAARRPAAGSCVRFRWLRQGVGAFDRFVK